MAEKEKLNRAMRSALVSAGFSSEGMGRWRKTRGEDWIDLIHVRVVSLDSQAIIEADLGLFSKKIDRICGWSTLAGFEGYDNLPQTPSLCHFYSRVFDLDEQGIWTRGDAPDWRLAFEDVNQENCQRLSRVLGKNIPASIERYGSIEAIANNYGSATGGNAGGKVHTMFAAAAMILLGQNEDVAKMLEDIIRPGTTEFEKIIHANILEATQE